MSHSSSGNDLATQAISTLEGLVRANAGLSKLLAALGGVGAEVYLVGGVVRSALFGEALFGEQSAEVDLSTNLSVADCQRALESAGIRTIETGLQHGTLSAICEGETFEITAFRVLGDPGATGSSIEDDLRARDFTINAVAYCPFSKHVIDPTGGISDLAQQLLRTPSDPAVIFAEDPLRVMRLARFVARLGFQVDAATLAAAVSVGSRLEKVSVERIREEFRKTIIGQHIASAFEILSSVGFFRRFIPEVEQGKGFEQNEFHIHDVYEHTLWVMNRAPNTVALRLAALFHDLGKPASLSIGEDGRRHFYRHEIFSADICKNRLETLIFPKQLIRHVTTLVRYHMRPLDCGPTGARRIIRDLSESFEDWLSLKRADSPPIFSEEENERQMNQFLELVRSVQSSGDFLNLAVDGHDLMDLGFTEGRKLGEVLHELRELVLEDPSNNEKSILLQKARERLA